MKITYCSSYEEMSQVAASLVSNEIKRKPDLLLCAATGNSPTGLYRILANKINQKQISGQDLRIIKLDEWGGVPENDPVTCERYLIDHVLDPMGISINRYISFRSDSPEPEKECERVRKELEEKGPIDTCILGIGKNGHIGFNEPDDYLYPFCHHASLTRESMAHSMIRGMVKKPSYGLTLGMSDILNSRKILILITGDDKKEVTNRFLNMKVSTDLPASFLWLHNNVECIIDQSCLA